MSKVITVKELKELLEPFRDDEIVIVRGARNGTFSHEIESVNYGKHKYTKDKVCIVGRSY